MTSSYKIKMDNLRSAFQAGWSIIGGIIGWFLGEGNPALYTLLTFMGIDYISGVMIAFVNHQLSSAIGAKGITKKLMILVFVGMGHLLDTQIIGSGQTLQTAIIFFYLSNEGISIIENATALGLPIPEKLKNFIQHMQQKK